MVKPLVPNSSIIGTGIFRLHISHHSYIINKSGVFIRWKDNIVMFMHSKYQNLFGEGGAMAVNYSG